MDILGPILKEASHAAALERPIAELRNAEQGKHALVVGNSIWRKGFCLESWDGPVIGCNALYRDWLPDYLCVYDSHMIDEVLRADVARGTRLILRASEIRAKVISAVKPETRSGWYAASGAFKLGGFCGTMAVGLGGYLGCTSLTLVGFSCDQSNVYAGSNNYVPKEHWKEVQLSAGGREESIGRLEEACRVYKEFVPQGFVHMIAPADWLLGTIRAHVAA